MTTGTDELTELSINTIRRCRWTRWRSEVRSSGAPMALAPLAFTLYTG